MAVALLPKWLSSEEDEALTWPLSIAGFMVMWGFTTPQYRVENSGSTGVCSRYGAR